MLFEAFSLILHQNIMTMTDPRLISIDDFDYPLPDSLIARHPLAQRDACRLMVRHEGD